MRTALFLSLVVARLRLGYPFVVLSTIFGAMATTSLATIRRGKWERNTPPSGIVVATIVTKISRRIESLALSEIIIIIIIIIIIETTVVNSLMIE